MASDLPCAPTAFSRISAQFRRAASAHEDGGLGRLRSGLVWTLLVPLVAGSPPQIPLPRQCSGWAQAE